MPTPTNHFLSCHYNNEVFVQTCTFPSVGNTAAEWTAAKRKDVMITTESFMVKVVPSLTSEININLVFFNQLPRSIERHDRNKQTCSMSKSRQFRLKTVTL